MPLALAVLEVAVSLTGCEPLPFIFSRDRYLKKESTSLCAFVFEATVPGEAAYPFALGAASPCSIIRLPTVSKLRGGLLLLD